MNTQKSLLHLMLDLKPETFKMINRLSLFPLCGILPPNHDHYHAHVTVPFSFSYCHYFGYLMSMCLIDISTWPALKSSNPAPSAAFPSQVIVLPSCHLLSPDTLKSYRSRNQPLSSPPPPCPSLCHLLPGWLLSAPNSLLHPLQPLPLPKSVFNIAAKLTLFKL